jgi:16S rRNA (guanine527-N7)-methyltransferase
VTPTEAETLRASAAALGVELPSAALDLLARYLGLLCEWNRRLPLTGDRDVETLIQKHMVDSLAPLPHLPPVGPVADIGSGAGFPGIVLACLRPSLEIVLIEPRRRAASFLREVIRSLPLPKVRVLEMRAEEAAPDAALAGRCRAVLSRAIRLDRFLSLARPLLASDGVVLALQTPGTVAADSSPGASASLGLELRATHDYALAGGERRRLAVFTSLS